MDALDLLLTRSSYGKLLAPAPAGEALENILKAGLRAPDHANLSPFEFIVCTGQGLNKLGSILEQAAIASDMPEATVEKSKTMTHRAPMIIVAMTRFKEHDKVPRVEQIATTACAVQNMQMAAYAQGFNGMWRTGSFATNEHVKSAFGLSDKDELVGFLYIGTPSIQTPVKKQKDPQNYVSFWQ